jgi:hypothetical protein
MVLFRMPKQKQKKPEISWPIESNRMSINTTDPTPSNSIPSLYSGSTETSTSEDGSTHRRSKSRFSFTSKGIRNSQCSDQSCSSIGLDISSPSKLPPQEILETAANIAIFDGDGNSRPFKSLYSGSQAIGEQQMIIFVRHFFCGVRIS